MAHEIEKLPVSAELLKYVHAHTRYAPETHSLYFSYYRSRVQESEGIVQDALGRLTCLEVLLSATNVTACIVCLVVAVVVMQARVHIDALSRGLLWSGRSGYGSTTACSTTCTT